MKAFNISYSHKRLHIFVLILFVLKFILLFFTQTVDADAVTRTQLGHQMMMSPRFIYEGIWAPIHIYLTGFSIWLYPDIILSPRIMNVIFSCLTLYPIYLFLKREFTAKDAFIGVLIFALSPIIFRTSLINLSETSFYLFLAIGMNLLSISYKSFKSVITILAGLCFSVAAGIRFEAWPLILFLGLSLLLTKQWKNAFIFGLSASLFPLFWIIGNYYTYGDMFHSIRAVNVLEVTDWENLLRKVWFFPFMLLISIGPFFLLSIIKGFTNFKKLISSPWILPPILFFLLLIYKSVTGTIVHHPRFIGTLTLLCLPLIFQENSWIKRISTNFNLQALGISLTLLLSIIYNTDGVSPLPLVKNKSVLDVTKTLETELKKDQDIFIDFIGWDNSYYISLELYPITKNQSIMDGYNSELQLKEKFDHFHNNLKTQYLILSINHKEWVYELNNVKLIFESPDMLVYKTNND